MSGGVRRYEDPAVPLPPPTPEQRSLAQAVADEWIELGHAVGQVDRDEVEAAVGEVYRANGYPAPRMVWFGSPLAEILGLVGLLRRHGMGAVEAPWSVGNSAWGELSEQARSAVLRLSCAPREDFGGFRGLLFPDPNSGWLSSARTLGPASRQTWQALMTQARDSVLAQVGNHLWGPVDGVVWGRWYASNPGRETARQLGRNIAGPPSMNTFVPLDCVDRCGVMRPTPSSASLMRLARSACYVFTLQDTAILVDRPVELHRDGQGRMHCESGPAIRYPDGWELWAWHGTRIPRDLIEEGWTGQRIMAERNSEVRRCAVEITAGLYGWRTLIHEAGWPQLGNAVPDPGNPGQVLTLWCQHADDMTHQDWSFNGPHLHLLHMTNGTVERDGTRREYGETVPGSITDPLEAAAWQVGLTADQYARTVRRT